MSDVLPTDMLQNLVDFPKKFAAETKARKYFSLNFGGVFLLADISF